MTPNEVREKYLNFFKERGHTIIPSAPLVPENDPTTLFTGSGMQPLIPYLLGKNHPAGNRLTDSQKSFRAMDIEEVGDNRHTTFFEMLGNWSLGDYFKQEQLQWFFEFLTKEIGLDPKRLYVSVYAGDEKAGVPRDTESAEVWKKLFSEKGIDAKEVELITEERGAELGMQGGRIFYYRDKNWWSRAGVPEKMPAGEPGGPDSEVFYEFEYIEHDPKFGANCHPNCDCGRYLEIGNSVFMEFIKNADGTFGKLPKRNVDFGGGLERIAAASQGKEDIFYVNHPDIISELERSSDKKYIENTYSFRIIADHIKAAVFLISDGVMPSNTDKGYFVRRLIRRAVRHADKIGITQSGLAKMTSVVAGMYKDSYPEIIENSFGIEKIINDEEERFRKTLKEGLKVFDRFLSQKTAVVGTAQQNKEFWNRPHDKVLSSKDVFELITTYGFPKELIIEEVRSRGIIVEDWDMVESLLQKHRDLSRAGSEQKFKGGLADTSEATTRLHTAHHLLLKALQIVLGPEVHQRGSNITQERLRIDFNYGAKMTDEQKKEVERIVNEKMQENLPVIRTEMSKDEAEKLGAEHEFGAKYPDRVSVYSIGPLENAFSIEFCGGPHVEHTSELTKTGTFKILKEEAVAQGIRRIRAVLQ